jgi:hypothetical protein
MLHSSQSTAGALVPVCSSTPLIILHFVAASCHSEWRVRGSQPHRHTSALMAAARAPLRRLRPAWGQPGPGAPPHTAPRAAAGASPAAAAAGAAGAASGWRGHLRRPHSSTGPVSQSTKEMRPQIGAHAEANSTRQQPATRSCSSACSSAAHVWAMLVVLGEVQAACIAQRLPGMLVLAPKGCVGRATVAAHLCSMQPAVRYKQAGKWTGPSTYGRETHASFSKH